MNVVKQKDKQKTILNKSGKRPSDLENKAFNLGLTEDELTTNTTC